MTIALGFTCQDGIVLGADTQLTATGSHKGYACKLFSHGSHLVPPSWLAATTYAGYPAFFDSFNDRFREEMHRWEKDVPITAGVVRDLIESVVKHLGAASKSTEILCAVVFTDGDHRLYKTKGMLVSEVRDSSYIGIGDSSLIRCILPLLTRHGVHGTQQAALIATCLIRSAKMYIDGCGGDTDIWMLSPPGVLAPCSHVPTVEQHIGMIEHFFGEVASGLFLDLEEAEFEDRIDRMCQRLRNERSELKRFFRPVKLSSRR